MDKIKNNLKILASVLPGSALAVSTWIILAVISASIYKYTGHYDLLLTHTKMWAISVGIASLMVDTWIFKRLGIKW